MHILPPRWVIVVPIMNDDSFTVYGPFDTKRLAEAWSSDWLGEKYRASAVEHPMGEKL